MTNNFIMLFMQTDTASVLTEAIGYIQFLHDRVQTLTVPTPSRNSSHRQPNSTTTQAVSNTSLLLVKEPENRGLFISI